MRSRGNLHCPAMNAHQRSPARLNHLIEGASGAPQPLRIKIALLVSLACALTPASSTWLQSALSTATAYCLLRSNWSRETNPLNVCFFIATLQLILAPMLAYEVGTKYQRYAMAVARPEYFATIAPCIAALGIGLAWPLRDSRRNVSRAPLQTIPNNSSLIATTLALAGAAATAAYLHLGIPASLRFPFYLAMQLSGVAAAYALSMPPGAQSRRRVLALALLPLAYRAIKSAMFHDVLLWAALLAPFALRRAPTPRQILFGGATLALAVFTLQGIKAEYRGSTHPKSSQALMEEVRDFWTEEDRLTSSDFLYGLLTRTNQGWIVSRVIHHVPRFEPHANGETITAALGDFAPRFLSPKKRSLSGLEMFEQFTGFQLADETSMGVSPIGEFYANFGRNGAAIASLLFGFMLRLAVVLWLRFAPTSHGIYWVPLLTLQAIKAETHFGIVANHLLKGAAFALIVIGVLQVAGFRFAQPVRDLSTNRRSTSLTDGQEERRSPTCKSPL